MSFWSLLEHLRHRVPTMEISPGMESLTSVAVVCCDQAQARRTLHLGQDGISINAEVPVAPLPWAAVLRDTSETANKILTTMGWDGTVASPSPGGASIARFLASKLFDQSDWFVRPAFPSFGSSAGANELHTLPTFEKWAMRAFESDLTNNSRTFSDSWLLYRDFSLVGAWDAGRHFHPAL